MRRDDLLRRDRLAFSIRCQTAGRGARAAPAVTEFYVLLNRTFTAVDPIRIGSPRGSPAGFSCGVRAFTARSTFGCVGGSIPYGKKAVGVEPVAPAASCNVHGLFAVFTARRNWDIFTIVKAPHVVNGSQCAAPHY